VLLEHGQDSVNVDLDLSHASSIGISNVTKMDQMVITLSFSLSKEGVSRVYFVKIWKWNQENVVLLDYNTILKGDHSDLISEENAKHHSVCLRPCANKS